MKTLNIFQRWKLRSLVAAARTDEAIAFLRVQGLSKGESAIALAGAGMEADAAKLAVHESQVWVDRHAADTEFHESLGRAVEGIVQGGNSRGGGVSAPDIEVQQMGVKITIADPASVDGGKPTPDAAARYEELIGRLEEIRLFAASRLLSIYNGGWLDDDHGVLDAAGFAQRLASPTLMVYEEGMTLVYFEDGDMFGGHIVQVTTRDGKPTDAEIMG